jgi:hypothetical protein
MALKNPWVTYVTRSYIDIKTGLLNRLGESVPEITDHSESNIMVIILDMFSGIAEMLNYYIDNMAREAFISTARRYSSMVKLTRAIDYRIKSAIPAQVDITVTFFDELNNPTGIDAFTLPIASKFIAANGEEFLSTGTIYIEQGAISMVIPVSQEIKITNQLLGITTADISQVYTLGTDYAYNTIDILVGGIVWTLKDTLGRSTPSDKHYIVDISPDKVAYIKFGDGVNGSIPTAGQEIRGDYSITKGIDGNVGINTITISEYDFTVHNVNSTIVTNYLAAVAGSDYEDIEKIRRSAPLSLRTLDRAVTLQDYIDITKLAPGVDKANLEFSCGKSIDIYIVPNGGGIAPQSLLDTTQIFVDLRKMLTTFVNILPTGQSDVVIDMDIKARFRASISETEIDIKAALTEAFSYANSDVNKPVRTSDLIALVDNLNKVNFLDLNSIYLIPYFRPTETSTPAIIKTMSIHSGSTTKLNWELKSDGTNMTMFKEGQQIATIPLETSYTDPENILTINISPNGYTAGMVWKFTTYPYNKNIELDNFSIPIITADNILLQISETLTI